MSKHLFSIVCISVLTLFATSLAHANWYAKERTERASALMSHGSFDEAIRLYREAILSYENCQKTKYSLDRTPIYYNLARAYYQKMQTFPLLSRGYEYYWQLGLMAAQRATAAQYKNPHVNRYFKTSPSELFDMSMTAGSKEIRAFLKMRNLVHVFRTARKMSMFKNCTNPGPSPASNILTIGPTEFAPGGVKSAPGSTRMPDKREIQPLGGPGTKGAENQSLERAQELGETTAKTNH
ncbi:hypothetical protein J7M28_07500 [bacterium]|nr:hypothetical protein [bacterium]